MVLDMSSDQQPPRLVVVADRRKASLFSLMAHGLHLVDNGGELMLVHRARCPGRSKFKRKYDVYRVDLDAGILIPAKGLNGRAVFMGMRRTISVSAGRPFPQSVLIPSIWDPNVMGKL
nr:uncharacterized protein LOC117845640 [Setaria viridis]